MSIVAVLGGVATLCPASIAAAKPTLTAPSVAAQRETTTVSVSVRGARGCRLSARGPAGRRQGLGLGRHSYTVRLAISPEAATGAWTLRVRCPGTRSTSEGLTVTGNPVNPGRRLFRDAKVTALAGARPKGYAPPRRRQNGRGGGGVEKAPVGIGSAAEDGGRAERAIAWAVGEIDKESYRGLGLRFVADAYAGLDFPRSATILANVLGPREGDAPASSAPLGALMWFALGDADRGRNDGHVGISLGDGRMVSAMRKVQIDVIDSSRWWRTRYRGWTPAPVEWAGRVPPPPPPPPEPVADVTPPLVTPPPVTPPPVTPPPVTPPPPVGKILTIDNRITNGMSMLQDGVPLQLTTVPRTYCRRDGCVIVGTERMTGDTYDSAVCQTTGVRFTNGHDRDPADDANPERFESTRYYGVKLAGTTTFGYTSEVWVRAADRGGLGLPVC